MESNRKVNFKFVKDGLVSSTAKVIDVRSNEERLKRRIPGTCHVPGDESDT